MEADVKKEFIQWILNDANIKENVTYFEEPHEFIQIEGEYANAVVDFYQAQFLLTELTITDKKNDAILFYLHFELTDLEHAKNLFREMMECFDKQKSSEKIRIMICCSSALTSSFFTTRIREISDYINKDYEFEAVSYNLLFEKGFDSDIVLLAPQIAFHLKEVKAVLKNAIVLKIPVNVFATYDCHALIEMVDKVLSSKRSGIAQEIRPSESIKLLNDINLLVIIVICEFNSKRIMYRMYEHGEIVRENTILKQKYYISDLEDLIDVLSTVHRIDHISICTPGVIDNGRLTFKESQIYDVDVKSKIEQKYNVTCCLVNDANAMAVGFYGMNEKYKCLSFYFHPRAGRFAGIGNVINGRLHTGRNNLAGEMQYLVNSLRFSDDPQSLALTPEGMLELLTQYITAVISCVDPQAIVIYCDMLADVEQLKKRLSKTFRAEFIPDLIKVDDVVEYMFYGGALLGMEMQ